MAIAGDVESVKVGVLMDIITDKTKIKTGSRGVMLEVFSLIFKEALASGRIDRPIELIYREVQGLPRGTVKAVVDGFASLVDEGCIMVCGPNISENTSAVREEIERNFRTPSLSMAGSDKWLGEWTFNLCNGSMSDEPAFLASLCRRAGHKKIGVLVERAAIGYEYLEFFRKFAAAEGLTIVCEAVVAQNSVDARASVAQLRTSGCDAVVYWGFGFGVFGFNDALKEVGWDPPRYCGTAFLAGYSNEFLRGEYMGWIGLDQYDEDNPVGQAFLDRYEAEYGRRADYFMTVVAHDLANCVVEAFSNAKPLSPTGVKEALERVKMMPAAAGSRGTRVSFGQWTRRGWMGAGYLTARQFTGEGFKSVLRGRFE